MATSVGILAAVVLLSATVLFSRVLSEAGVRYALYSQAPAGLDIQILSGNRSLAPEDYEQLRFVAESAIDQRLGELSTHVERFGRTQAGMPLATNPSQRPPPVTTLAGRPFFMTGFPQHSKLIEGSWPQGSGKTGPAGVELQTVVGQKTAKDQGYEVGDRLYITPFRSSPEERIVLDIVGVVAPIDSRDEFWMGYPSQFSLQAVGEMFVVPAYVTEEDFLQVLGSRFSTAIGDFGYNVFIDPSKITAQMVDATQESLVGLETDLNKSYPRTFVFSRLGLTLDEFERDLTLARVPVYVFVSLVIIIVFYFLVLISGILGRTQSDELGLLRGRGGSLVQVCGVLLLADGMLAAATVAVGPLLAWVIVRYAMLPVFSGLGGGPIEVPIIGEMFWIGAIGSVLSLAVLSLSAAVRARSGVAESMASRSRPPGTSFLQRYYLDIVAILAVGLVWWQFSEREGFLTRSLASRGLEVDPAVILGPVLGLLAAALLLLRLLPMVVRLTVWLCMRAGPAWSSFGMARVARDPVLPSSLAVLLMLAAALGVFGATFQSSLSSSQREQALYRVGGDVVISGPGVREDLAGELEQLPGVSTATPVLQETISLASGRLASRALLMAADPEGLAQSGWFRDDFANSTLLQLTEGILTRPVEGPAGVPLPSGLESIGVWLDTRGIGGTELASNINVWAKLVDDVGIYRNVSLGSFVGQSDGGAENWRLFAGDLSERMVNLDADWTLTAIFLTTSSFARVPSGSVHLDDITAFGPSLPTNGIVVEDFESMGLWRSIVANAGVQDILAQGPAGARYGSYGLTFSWVEPFTGQQRGIHIPPVNLPIPAIGGGGLGLNESLWIKHGQAYIPIKIVGVTELFPTVSNPQRPFLIVDLNAYESYRRFLPSVGLVDAASQIWLSLDPSYNRDDVISSIERELPELVSAIDRTAVAERASRNPLAGGGWNGLTGLSMSAVGIAVGIASLLYSVATARAARVDTAVARSLGLSTRQLLLTLLAEKWLMAGVAILAGAAIGYWPGLELIQMLDLTPGRSTPVPPLVPQVHELLLGLVLAGLTIAVVGSVLYSAVLARRVRPAEVLRMGA